MIHKKNRKFRVRKFRVKKFRVKKFVYPRLTEKQIQDTKEIMERLQFLPQNLVDIISSYIDFKAQLILNITNVSYGNYQ